MLRRQLGRITAGWGLAVAGLLLVALTITILVWASPQTWTSVSSSRCPQSSCLDVLILYHEDDAHMLIDNGGLDSALDNLIGVRNFYILSARNATLRRYLQLHRRTGMPQVHWIDESRAPFSRKDFEGPKGHAGWFYQQALKFWAVAHVPELCNDVMVMDSDNLWVKRFDVRQPVPKRRDPLHHGGTPPCPSFRYKYCLSSKDSGAYEGDIGNGDYHHFVNWLLGMPKELRTTHTAISNWQVMQRDVLATLELGLQDRGFSSIHEALITYNNNFNSMSEYEAYFALVWRRFTDRVEPVYLPFMLRDPKRCNYHNKTLLAELRDRTSIVYLTCHDHWGTTGGVDDFYINCKGRQAQCGQPANTKNGLWDRAWSSLGRSSRRMQVAQRLARV